MNTFQKNATILTALSALPTAFANQQHNPYQDHQWQAAPIEHFSGNARFARLPTFPDNPNGTAIVEFDAGTITHWHSHSQGQYLIVTHGEGRTQEWGKPVQVIKAGDTVWCPPNVKHWHGAAENSRMSHIAISPNAAENKVTWLEKVERAETDRQTELQKIRQNEPLTDKQLALVAIAFHTAKGEQMPLETALTQGLEQSLTTNELREIFLHQSAYIGFPRALNGLATLQNLLEKRKAQGIVDPQGETAEPADHQADYYDIGSHRLSILTQRDAPAQPQGFDGTDYALKAHLFGYLFNRENLSAVNRELAAATTLISLENTPNQLRSH